MGLTYGVPMTHIAPEDRSHCLNGAGDSDHPLAQAHEHRQGHDSFAFSVSSESGPSDAQSKGHHLFQPWRKHWL